MLPGGGIDHPDEEVMDEQDHGGLGVGSPDADVMQAPVDPKVMLPESPMRSLRTRSWGSATLVSIHVLAGGMGRKNG